MKAITLVSLFVLALVGCGKGQDSDSGLEVGPTVEGFRFLQTSDVADGKPISPHIGCDGEGVSPTLAWRGVPDGTSELALVLEDPDAPNGTFTHWLVYGIEPTVTALSDSGAVAEGTNDFGVKGYGAPCPPRGLAHHYVFRLLALRHPVELGPGADRAAFDEAVAPHVLAEARLTATYERS